MTDPSEVGVINWTNLNSWMSAQGFGSGGASDIAFLGGGTQNILARFRFGERSFMLRRPPLHKRTNSDWTLRRESRVLSALSVTTVPHPAFIAKCEDEAVIGSIFYLMEPVEGINAVNELSNVAEWSAESQHTIGLAMADAIVEVGNVDVASAGLSDFGNAENWTSRQVPRWLKQLQSYPKNERYTGTELPGLQTVASWLTSHEPRHSEQGLIHGDFHFGNVIFDRLTLGVAAIVDWELATLGDPLLDLGHLLSLWPQSGSPPGTAILELPGLPPREEVIARYSERSIRRLDEITWYQILACFRLGIILEGTFARSLYGEAELEVGVTLHRRAMGLFEQALFLISSEG